MARNQMPGITLEGDSELGELLKSLPGNVLSEIKIGMREVGKIVVKAAQSKLFKGHGYDSGQLKKSLGVLYLKSIPNENRIVMGIGPRMGFDAIVTRTNEHTGETREYKHNPKMIAHLVEFGHRASGINANGSDVPAKPFLRPAIDETKDRFNRIMIARIKKVLENRAKRAAKKAA